MSEVEADKCYVTVKCKIPGCGQCIVVAEAPQPSQKIDLPGEPFVTVCSSCTWIQRFLPADVTSQAGKTLSKPGTNTTSPPP